jgi:hypothetical protein
LLILSCNLSYNLHRDYNPDWGGYLESDPIGLAGGLNTYTYVDGNALSGFDNSGMLTRLLIDEGNGKDVGHVAIQIDNTVFVFGFEPDSENSTNVFELISGTKGVAISMPLSKFLNIYNNQFHEDVHAFTLDLTQEQENQFFVALVNATKKHNLLYQGLPTKGENCTTFAWKNLNNFTNIKRHDNPLFPWVDRIDFQLLYLQHFFYNTGVTNYEIIHARYPSNNPISKFIGE